MRHDLGNLVPCTVLLYLNQFRAITQARRRFAPYLYSSIHGFTCLLRLARPIRNSNPHCR